MIPLLLLLTATLGPGGPQASPSPCGASAGAASGLVSSYPPCFEVTLEAEATGAPPLSYTWSLPGGATLSGNPAVLDTALLPAGFHEITLTVTNAAGVATYPVLLAIEELGFSSLPTFSIVDGTTVSARANTTGATEWRWSWGDGTSSGWLSGCEGYAPAHTYPAPGTYSVSVEARSCRSGPLTATGTLDLGGSTAPLIERFQAVCPTEPFCSFDTGEAVPFDVLVSVTVDSYLVDWNGDGFDEEVTFSPVTSHVFTAPGYYLPRLTVLAGTSLDVRYHEAPIEVLGSPALLFSDGFESGDLRHWTLP
jgi:PKD repeat protein